MSSFLIINNKEELILIPNEAIRIRVIANSNNKEDLEVKEQVKDVLNKKVEKLLKNVNTIEEVRKIINNNLEFINKTVEKKLNELNYNTSYSINYGLNYFPNKVFKGIKYDEGYYESLVITLGEGNGKNYWCVLYPPLCLLEDETSNNEYRSYVLDLIKKYLT